MKSKQEAYIAKYRARIEQWEADIKKRKAIAAEMAADLQIGYANQTADLERKVATVRAHMSKLQQSSEDVWEAVKEGFETAWADLHSAWEKAKVKLSTVGKSA
jgi:hypothetical protein